MIATAPVAENGPHQISLPDSFRNFDSVPSSPLRLKRGRTLFHAGDPFVSIYTVRFGSFKMFAGDHEGRHQVTGFALPGDVIGLDGIGEGRQSVTAVALEDSEVILRPFASVERAARDDRSLQHELHALMSRQLVHDQGVMMMLGSLCASERVAAFLLNLSRRYQRLGYSLVEFNLRMTRADIASYIGIQLETVSRTLTLFAGHGFIEVHEKHIRLIDPDGLERTAKGNLERTGAGKTNTRTDRLVEQAGMVHADARNTRKRSVMTRSLVQSMRSGRVLAGV